MSLWWGPTVMCKVSGPTSVAEVMYLQITKTKIASHKPSAGFPKHNVSLLLGRHMTTVWTKKNLNHHPTAV